MSLDRQRIDAVKLLESQGYAYSESEGWKGKAGTTSDSGKPPVGAQQIFCEECGSLDVRRDGDACWDVVKQDWELNAVFDNGSCERCGGEASLGECDLEDVAKCSKCKEEFHIDYIDGKDDGSGNFNILECKHCYGPGWCKA